MVSERKGGGEGGSAEMFECWGDKGLSGNTRQKSKPCPSHPPPTVVSSQERLAAIGADGGGCKRENDRLLSVSGGAGFRR